MVLYSVVSLVSIDPEGAQDRSARDALALAQGGLSLLLALEIASKHPVLRQWKAGQGWPVLSINGKF